MFATNFERAFPRTIFLRYVAATGVQFREDYQHTAMLHFEGIIKHSGRIDIALETALKFAR